MQENWRFGVPSQILDPVSRQRALRLRPAPSHLSRAAKLGVSDVHFRRGDGLLCFDPDFLPAVFTMEMCNPIV